MLSQELRKQMEYLLNRELVMKCIGSSIQVDRIMTKYNLLFVSKEAIVNMKGQGILFPLELEQQIRNQGEMRTRAKAILGHKRIQCIKKNGLLVVETFPFMNAIAQHYL